ncbi:helix-turn-helix transcriptional regulator [Hydrogenoanaerobacterium sp.]|uniref:helix-turn-helix domain-containing protein n=1 Tax=Hydrogenoanaerobacterium sp. TaxID=2953763 RepID=UPI002898872A|nr:helix-turn-helix transcriptional regulator [Hydrogenoanaerobacterium sp.]
MSREQYIKRLIKENGYTLKDFAQQIGMPYSTLLSMLNGSIGGAAIDSVLKICRGLGITISNLQQHVQNFDENDRFGITEAERRLITQYRLHPDMQAAVNKLLSFEAGIG